MTGWTPRDSGRAALQGAMDQAGATLGDLAMVVGTGYGRVALPFADETVTEISCHARGAHFFHPQSRTVIDIGGQDSKVVAMDEEGHPCDFAMNDRCAAGTGRFLQVMAAALGVEVGELGGLAAESYSPSELSCVCTVFAESEIVGLIADGASRRDIAAGLCLSVVRRVAALASQVKVREDVVLSGGVAHNDSVLEMLRAAIGVNVVRADEPQLVGAMGAAVIAAEKAAEGG